MSGSQNDSPDELITFAASTPTSVPPCMPIMLEFIWPSFRQLQNNLPISSGMQSYKLIAYFVFWMRGCFQVGQVWSCYEAVQANSSGNSISPAADQPSENEVAILDQINVRCDSCLWHARLGRPGGGSRACFLTACDCIREFQELGLGDEYKRGSQWQDNARLEYCKLDEHFALF
jgi:hypothetical protein